MKHLEEANAVTDRLLSQPINEDLEKYARQLSDRENKMAFSGERVSAVLHYDLLLRATHLTIPSALHTLGKRQCLDFLMTNLLKVCSAHRWILIVLDHLSLD